MLAKNYRHTSTSCTTPSSQVRLTAALSKGRIRYLGPGAHVYEKWDSSNPGREASGAKADCQESCYCTGGLAQVRSRRELHRCAPNHDFLRLLKGKPWRPQAACTPQSGTHPGGGPNLCTSCQFPAPHAYIHIHASVHQCMYAYGHMAVYCSLLGCVKRGFGC